MNEETPLTSFNGKNGIDPRLKEILDSVESAFAEGSGTTPQGNFVLGIVYGYNQLIKSFPNLKSPPSPPSVKPEREEPFTVWAHEYSDKIALDSRLSLRDHIGGEIYAALMAAYGRLFFGPWQTFEAGKPVGEVLLLTTSKIIVIGDWYEDGWRTPRSTWEPIPGSKFQKLKHIYGEKDVTHWMPKPQIQSPTSPAVQQEDGEDVSVIDIILGGIALKDKVASLQSQLYTSQQERATLQQEVLSVKAEAAEYRNALIKIEILGTAVESPGVFESGRGWEATKNKYAEIAWAARVKYIQQTPTK